MPLADPNRSREAKLEVAQDLFQADERTLDSASIRLRRRAGTRETLLEPKFQRLIFHGVNKIVLSTAFVECLFGQYSQWQRKSPKPIGLGLLGAKHTSHQFNAGAERKRKRENDESNPPQRRRPQPTRPAWVFKRGDSGRSNARHSFISDIVAERGHGTPPQSI